MYKQHLLQNIQRELILLKQLAPFIKESDLEFRPAEKVRSTYELMQYLSGIGGTSMRILLLNDITPEERLKLTEYRATLTIDNFCARLDEQWDIIQQYFASITDEQLMTMEVTLPWKEKMPLGSAIISATIKWLAAYRMELFLYLKMNGRPELGTKDAWVPEAIRVNP